MSNIRLPDLMDILFENPQLERTRVICILSSFPKHKNGITLKELAYYYALIVSEYETSPEKELRYNIANLYITLQLKMKKIIPELNNLEYIEVFGSIGSTFDSIKVKLNTLGIEVVNSLENEYFKEFKAQVEEVKKNYKYSPKLEKELLNRRVYG